jgi:hypothetical protein
MGQQLTFSLQTTRAVATLSVNAKGNTRGNCRPANFDLQTTRAVATLSLNAKGKRELSH